MFWFWFIWAVFVVLVVLDAAWWKVSLRLLKGSRWRIPVSVFMAAQLIAVLSVMCGFEWLRQLPMIFVISANIWHHFALAVLLPLGILASAWWVIRSVARGGRKPGSVPGPSDDAALSRRKFIAVGAALAPPLLNLGLTGIALVQLKQLRVRRFELSVPALPRALDGLTIAHVSDIHVGGFTYQRVLREMVNKTNSLRPDLVLVTGDLIDARLADLSEGIDLVKAMPGRYGQWMIEGNHDLYEDGGEFKRRVKAAGIPFLSNESALAEVRGHPVQFFGLRWLSGSDKTRDRVTEFELQTLMTHRQPDAFPILLAHHPHAFDAAARANLPLTLSGHTHGGQWMLDNQLGVGPVLFRYWSGLYARGSSQMIVSNGIGNVFPIRLNAPAEIVHITLHCA